MLALLLDAYPVRVRTLLTVFLFFPFLIPPAAFTTALTMSLGSLGGPTLLFVRGVTGAIFISALQMTPIVLWGIWRTLASIPRSERQAMQVALPPRQALLKILLPRVVPTSGRMAILLFLLLVPLREIPDYCGAGETVGTRILSAFSTAGNDTEGWLVRP